MLPSPATCSDARSLPCTQGQKLFVLLFVLFISIPSEVFSILRDDRHSVWGGDAACRSTRQSSARVVFFILTLGLACAYLHESELALQMAQCHLHEIRTCLATSNPFFQRGSMVLCPCAEMRRPTNQQLTPLTGIPRRSVAQ